MVTKWLVMALLMVTVGQAKASDRRVAEATWQQVDGCESITTHVVATLSAIEAVDLFPDGWARDILITVEHRDTCAGVQLANLSGQTMPLADELDIARKLDGATVSTTVAMLNGVTGTGGQLHIAITWDALTKRRNASVRPAAALLAADGMGLTLRNYTEQATISAQ